MGIYCDNLSPQAVCPKGENTIDTVRKQDMWDQKDRSWTVCEGRDDANWPGLMPEQVQVVNLLQRSMRGT